MSKLFSSFKIKDMEIKNRIVMAPMCMYSSDSAGYANDWHYIHYSTRAIGGTGLIILEATGVEPGGCISSKDLGIWDDSHIEGLKNIVDQCHKYGAKVGIQLNHAGRKSEVLSEPMIAPSALAFDETYRTPVEMTKEDIARVVKLFKDASERVLKAGFDTIEIHGAHGYLISQFLSPLSNKREDEYGGSLENRARFLKELVSAVRSIWPEDKPLILRVSAEDYVEGGNTPETMAELINLVKSEGIDIVNVSTGGVAPATIHAFSGYQVKASEIINKNCELPTIAGGLISEPYMAEEILSNNRADLVFLGRELLRNPYWPLKAAHDLHEDIQYPTQYERGKYR
ncbi:NADPH dehydrogenase NamA [Clostridium sp. C8-1-8]|uniref:NADPH dehydrogenase NamA n=1 Tax=Clostridium sp. C8-1-8 TaxID=2698831 RepID=UPI00136A799B|nr:NADPH dehydrogenase NamA [Clostridium sp. C8-1-8]